MKKYLGFVIQIGIGVLCGAALGILAAVFLPPVEGAMFPVCILIGIGAGTFLHIILHEGGHLVCGLLSGYRFVSFRVGSRVLVKSNGKYLLRKFSIPGTAGQCLLDPPDLDEDGNFPAKLYNFGGGLANFVFAGFAFIGMMQTESGAIGLLLLTFAVFGIALGLMNLVPLKMNGVANDGYNILSLDKDPVGSKAFWQQLRVNRLSTDGVRLKDMDEDLFALAFEEAEGNPLVDQIKFFWMQRLIDEKRFDEARVYGRKLVHAKDCLQILKWMAGVELLYLELMGDCDGAVVKALYSKDIQKWMKAVKCYPSTHRVRYAYATRFAHDEKMAAKAAADFAKACRQYPMLGEIETEKELFEEI